MPAAPARGPRATGALDSGRWLLRGRDGRLTAYARAEGGLLRWTETRPGGPEWTGPAHIAAPGLTYLTVAQGADGYAHLIGRRVREGAEGPGAAVDIVHAIQYQTGRPVTEWRSLGNAHKDPAKASRFGVPAAAVDASGTVYVVVRNAGHGVQLRRENAKGAWEPWKDLKGTQVLDGGLAATALSCGRVEVAAPARGGQLRFQQDGPGGQLTRAEDVPFPAAAGSVAALETAPGRLTYYWTDPEGGVVARAPGGAAVALGGSPADGCPPGLLRATVDGHDCTLLSHRGPDGRTVLGACLTGAEADGVWWSPTGEPGLGAPALTLDAHSRVVAASIGTDGTLHIARQRPEQGLALGAWTRW